MFPSFTNNRAVKGVNLLDKQGTNRNGNSTQQNAGQNNRQGSNCGRGSEKQNRKGPSQCSDSTDSHESNCRN
jgi:hypothetical protein